MNLIRDERRKIHESLLPYKYFCTLCSFKSKRQKHLENHLKQHQKVTELLQCRDCDFKCIRSGDLSRHRIVHASVILKCRVDTSCKFHTDNEAALEKHEKYSHKKKSSSDAGQLVFSCSSCNYKTLSVQFFNRHLKTHENKVGRSSKKPAKRSLKSCTLCPYSTAKTTNMVRHVSSVHKNERNFTCQFCPTSFKRQDTLKQHLATHADRLDKADHQHVRNMFDACTTCGKVCRSRTDFAEHMAAAHSKSRDYLCDLCGAGFKSKSIHLRHIKLVHKNTLQEEIQCSKCDKSFSSQSKLLAHESKCHSKEIIQVEEISETPSTIVYTLTIDQEKDFLMTNTGTVLIANSVISNPNKTMKKSSKQ